ncbi:MAG: hypothetical protein NTZ05_04105, partial [Chloroflexi bacterium]|nr:hypothetical protein [Chloroflexota bacterium]
LVEKSKVRLIRNERALDAVTLLAYLRAVSSNVLSSHWSKRRRNELSLDQLLEEDPGLVHSESERTSLHEMEEDFANLTNGLTDNDRKLLRYLVNGYSLGEAAEGLGISYSAAGVRLHRLRRRLLGRSARRGE